MKAVRALISLVGVMLLGSISFAATCPESVPAPTYQVGDRFVWEYTTAGEKVWEVIGIEGGLTEVKWSDPDARWGYDNAGTFFLDQDWVIRKGVNKQAAAVVSPKPGSFAMLGQKLIDFPLQLGKTWDVSFRTVTFGSQVGHGGTYFENYFMSLKVVGCEEVATSAGRFPALRINGHLTNATRSGDGTLDLWYSPAAKNFVKFRLGQCMPSIFCTLRPPQDYDLTKLDLR